MSQPLETASRTLLEAQKSVLQMIAAGNPLAAILDALCRIIEDQAGQRVRAAIVLVDPTGKLLVTGAAPSLPEEYSRAIDGIAIDSSVGPCAAAATAREAVLTPAIANDPGWSLLRHLPPKLGFKPRRPCPSCPRATTFWGRSRRIAARSGSRICASAN